MNTCMEGVCDTCLNVRSYAPVLLVCQCRRLSNQDLAKDGYVFTDYSNLYIET